MNREELEAYILNHYSTEADYPWADTPRAAVFRHAGNRKWFALVMDVPRGSLPGDCLPWLPAVQAICKA